MPDFSGGRLGTKAEVYKSACSLQYLCRNYLSSYFPTDSWVVMLFFYSHILRIYFHLLVDGWHATWVCLLCTAQTVSLCLSSSACVCHSVPVGVVNKLFDSLICSLLSLSLLTCLQSSTLCCSGSKSSAVPERWIARLLLGFIFETQSKRGIVRGEGETWVVCWQADCDSMPCVCATGPQEEATLGCAGWTSPEEFSEQASQAQHLERLAQLCIMSKQ